MPLFLNTALPSVSTDFGIVTLVSFSVPSNAEYSIVLSCEFAANVSVSIGVYSNAFLPMNVTLAGIVTDLRLE